MQYLTDLQLEILEKIAAILPLPGSPLRRMTRKVRAAEKRRQKVERLSGVQEKLKKTKPKDVPDALKEYFENLKKPLPKPNLENLRKTEFDLTFGPLKKSKRNQ